MQPERPSPYADYPAFEAAFAADHAALAAQHPFALMAVELELRKERAGIAGFGAATARPRGERFVVDGLAGLSLRLRPGRTPVGRAYVKLSGLEDLRGRLGRHLAARGLAPLAEDRVLGFRRSRQFHALATRGPAFATFLRRLARIGASAAAADEALMARLDAEIRRNRDDLARLMRDLDLRLMISDGDAMPFQRVLVSAAEVAGVPYVTLAHGYVQNRHLVSIAPIRGDALLTWTEEEAANLRAVLDARQAAKIGCFGFPRHNVPRSSGSGDVVLVAWDPVSLKAEADWPAQIEALAQVVAAAGVAGLPARVRLHPKDRDRTDITAALVARGMTLSTEPLPEALAASRAVVGSTSSVIFEAMATGLPGIQIVEQCRGVAIAGASLVPAAGLADCLRNLPQGPGPAIRPFDLDGFVAYLDALMSRAGSAAG